MVGSAGVDCTASSGQTVDCSLASLAAGASATVTVAYSVAADVADATVSNTASAASDEDSDSGSADLTITNDVDLTVTKVFDPATVSAGDGSHDFTITVTNDGTFSDADNLTISDTVDSRLVVSAVVGSAGVDCTASSGQTVDCSLASLAAGASATVTVSYSVAADVADATVSNTASAASDEDSDSGSADLTSAGVLISRRTAPQQSSAVVDHLHHPPNPHAVTSRHPCHPN